VFDFLLTAIEISLPGEDGVTGYHGGKERECDDDKISYEGCRSITVAESNIRKNSLNWKGLAFTSSR